MPRDKNKGSSNADTEVLEHQTVSGDQTTDSVTVTDTGEELPGDGGAREQEVETAIDRVGELADMLDLSGDTGKVVTNLADYFLELFKHRPKPWDQLTQSEQRDLYTQLKNNAKETVRIVVEAVARNDREAIRAMLESYTEKDGIKVTLKVKTFDETEALAAVVGLHKAQGKHVLITVASADDYDDGTKRDPSQPDEPGLNFEAGSDHPDDDSDLAGEAESDLETRVLKDGDAVMFAGEPGKVRIDVNSGWVQFNADNDGDDEWQDMREGTTAELAAERERTADFTD